MRKLWFRRRAVSTMIGGIIVLAIFLVALVAMVVVSQQYDSYQLTVNRMQQRDIDRFSENLEGTFPGISTAKENPVTSANCPGGQCKNYTMFISNLGIGARIARIYINSTDGACVNTCIFDPSDSATAIPYMFKASNNYLNSGEFFHTVAFWVPGDTFLPIEQDNPGTNTVWIVTTRGRVFSFLAPFPATQQNPSVGAAGGTGLYIGPLVYTFQRGLLSYTNSTMTIPVMPIGGTNGYWILPTGTLVIYVKVQTDVGVKHDVYLTPQSVFEIARFDSPGVVNYFFAIAPPTLTICNQIKTRDPAGDIVCDPSYGYNDSVGNTGNPANIVPYLPCGISPTEFYTTVSSTYPGPGQPSCQPFRGTNPGPRYRIPAPNQAQQDANLRGTPVLVAFASLAPGGTNQGDNPQSIQPAWAGNSVTSFLGMTYVWDEGDVRTPETGELSYVYGVTLPFVAMCINNGQRFCNI